MRSVTVNAPAKVNLFLKILNKRQDGYHNIHTLFERISLADQITISKIPSGIKLTSDKFITRNPKDNLVYKAAKLMLEGVRGQGSGVKIQIKKRIPIAAGLGGGSSDAAATLVGMNKLFGVKLKQSELMKLGARLGADVPFFLMGAPFAIGKGKGDRLKRANPGTMRWHLVIYPGTGFKLATKDIYNTYDRLLLTRKAQNVKIPPLLHNDLEEAASAQNSGLSYMILRLASSLGKRVVVSGSGPSVFCLYRTRKEALEARRKLFRCVPAAERSGWQVFVVETLR